MTNSFGNDFYRSPKTLSYIVIGLFGSLILCSIAYIVLSLVIIALPEARIELDEGGTAHLGTAFIGLISLLEIPLRIATIVLFLIWLYRAYKNLSPLQAGSTEFSPGWAVGWWFIPFANLVKPFQVVRDLYNESTPDLGEEMGFLKVGGGTPALVGFWWAFFLAGNFALRITGMLIDDRGNLAPEFPIAMIVAGFLTIVGAGLALLIVKNITLRQDQRFAKIAARQNYQPPSPAMYFNQNG